MVNFKEPRNKFQITQIKLIRCVNLVCKRSETKTVVFIFFLKNILPNFFFY